MGELGGSSAGFVGGAAPPERGAPAPTGQGRWGPRSLSAWHRALVPGGNPLCRHRACSPSAALETKTKRRGVPGLSSCVSPPVASVSGRPQGAGGAADSGQRDPRVPDPPQKAARGKAMKTFGGNPPKPSHSTCSAYNCKQGRKSQLRLRSLPERGAHVFDPELNSWS